MLLDLLAGLALLLGGMRLLAAALQRALGGPAGEFLARLDGRPWLAAAGGAAVTALLQSSSVTTLVIAGLADARILSLSAAAGAIMGANVGTTLTAYLTALDPLRAAPWLVAGGAAGLVVSAVPAVRRRLPVAAAAAAPAVAALGLGVAMAGLRGIEAAVQPLAAGGSWESHLRSVEHRPLAGLVAGVVITTLLDSSSAAIAVLQRLVQSGMLSLAGAIPVLLGDNIGTTTATVIAAAVLGARGRRAACVHLLFNLAGVALWWPLRNTLVAVAQGAATPAAGLARVHLLFNLTAALVQLPLIRLHLAATARLFPGGVRPGA
ncbi:MAG TPA: Na/Pi symporter [Bacillota bacterium]